MSYPFLDSLSAWLHFWTGINAPSAASGSRHPPSLDAILVFTQVLLDAHFVSLLQDTAAHDVLQRMSKHIHSHTQMAADFQALHTPLAAFLAMQHARSMRQSRMDDDTGKKKSKRLTAHELSMAVGEYSIETFDL